MIMIIEMINGVSINKCTQRLNIYRENAFSKDIKAVTRGKEAQKNSYTNI